MRKIDVIELCLFENELDHINCPFCQRVVVEVPEEEEIKINPCDHTLFAACDDGFMYRSERFNKHMNVPDGDDNYHGKFKQIDDFTSAVTLCGSIKYADYMAGRYGTYYGFAPIEG